MDGIELIVRGHFDGYKPGDRITDPSKIKEILSGVHEFDVVKKLIEQPVKDAVKPVYAANK